MRERGAGVGEEGGREYSERRYGWSGSGGSCVEGEETARQAREEGERTAGGTGTGRAGLAGYESLCGGKIGALDEGAGRGSLGGRWPCRGSEGGGCGARSGMVRHLKALAQSPRPPYPSCQPTNPRPPCPPRAAHTGTTLTVLLVIGPLITAANVGDSSAVMATGHWTAALTATHRIHANGAERARLAAAGRQLAPVAFSLKGPAGEGEQGVGQVRVWPGGLSTSRAIGAAAAGPEVLPLPHIKQVGSCGVQQAEV